MNKTLATKLLTYANSGDSDQATSDAMRKAAMKIEYLEEILCAVKVNTIKNYPFEDVRGESWFDARLRALEIGEWVDGEVHLN